MSVTEKQKLIIEEFSKLSSWEDKYKKIIQMGKELPEFPSEYVKEEFLVKGCQSQVWLYAFNENSKMHIIGDSDAMIVKGLLALLLNVFNDEKPTEVMQAPVDFIEKLGLNVHLSQSRSNGLAAMIKQIKLFAMAFHTINLNQSEVK